MAYEPRAAASIQMAEISSPRESASTLQAMAPTTATSDQTAMDLADSFRFPEAGGVSSAMMVPSHERWRKHLR
ncbi:hypothetical protein NQP46_23840 [Streptomyces albus]|nr:hypothetical protein NQP46_23840 [Streptomyces albus]